MAEQSTLRPTLLAPIALAALVIGAAASYAWLGAKERQLQGGILLENPRPVPGFSLLDQDGQPFGRADLEGRWSIVFAGFTHCPDVCPTTLALLRQVQGRLEGQQYNTVFLSVDPQRDTPERMRQYVRHFSPRFTGLTGDASEIDRLCQALGIAWVRVPGENPGEYTVDHSTSLVVLNPRGEVAAYLQAPHDAETIARDMEQLLKWRT